MRSKNAHTVVVHRWRLHLAKSKWQKCIQLLKIWAHHQPGFLRQLYSPSWLVTKRNTTWRNHTESNGIKLTCLHLSLQYTVSAVRRWRWVDSRMHSRSSARTHDWDACILRYYSRSTSQPISSRADEHMTLGAQPLVAAKSCCLISVQLQIAELTVRPD